jgi:HEAT repeat protein
MPVHLALPLAAMALIGAMAATRLSSEEAGSEAALPSHLPDRRSDGSRCRAVPADPSPAIRSDRPVEATAGLQGSLTTDQVLALLKSRSRVEQGRGLRALASIDGRGEKLSIARQLIAGGDASLRSRALLLLKEIHGSEAVALAADILQGDGPAWLRAQAAGVLGDLGEAGALPALLNASRDDDLYVRAGAASALDRFGQSAPMRELISTLADLLDHRDGGMREDAVAVLSTLRTPDVVPVLAKALVDPTNSRVRESAADALGRTALADALPFLEGSLHDSDVRVRRAVRQALDRLRADLGR